MKSDSLNDLAVELGRRLKARGLKVATAESCTGGWVSMEITAVAGSSDWFERGFVTYSNDSKRELLGVQARTLEQHGAVSEPVAVQMAQGALARSAAGMSVSVTGIAGPGGETPGKPVGTVCFAWAGPAGRIEARTHRFAGDRESVRRQSVAVALEGLLECLGESNE
jgi:nicotinamide-nucleotide amidase